LIETRGATVVRGFGLLLVIGKDSAPLGAFRSLGRSSRALTDGTRSAMTK
jgi:hypothetical protein